MEGSVCAALRLVVKLLDGDDEVIYAGAVGAVRPFSVVADAIYLIVEADRAAFCDAELLSCQSICCDSYVLGHEETYVGSSLYTVAQKIHSVGSIVRCGTLVKSLHIDGMFEGAIFYQASFGDVLVVFGQAHDESEVDLGIGIEFAGAEFENVAHAFRGAVLALYTVVCCWPLQFSC